MGGYLHSKNLKDLMKADEILLKLAYALAKDNKLTRKEILNLVADASMYVHAVIAPTVNAGLDE